LSNEEGNVEHMRKLIENEKKRVDRDFDNFIKEIIHIVEDLKLSVYAQLDCVFMGFMDIYKNMKDRVVRMKENRRKIIDSIPREESEGRSTMRSQIMSSNNKSNINMLQELSKD
jgi:hypothetical protein